ncbi:MAG: XTP/dITP diphosphatase [Planctomycetota bacterium]
MKRLVLASQNPKKVMEIQQILKGVGVEVVPVSAYPQVGEIEETGDTFEANAALKAETVSQITGEAALADDSGLVVDCLDGRPGVYSARFSGPNASDQDNNAYLLEQMVSVASLDRRAAFVCCLALARPGQTTRFFQGRCEGTILDERRGDQGFGYDPLFFCPTLGKTFAEATAMEKSEVSHRGQALREFAQFMTHLCPATSS